MAPPPPQQCQEWGKLPRSTRCLPFNPALLTFRPFKSIATKDNKLRALRMHRECLCLPSLTAVLSAGLSWNPRRLAPSSLMIFHLLVLGWLRSLVWTLLWQPHFFLNNTRWSSKGSLVCVAIVGMNQAVWLSREYSLWFKNVYQFTPHPWCLTGYNTE